MQDTLKIVLKDGTKLFCVDDTEGGLYRDIMTVRDMALREGVENLTLNITGLEWPIEAEIPCASIKYIESTKRITINFNNLPEEN